MRLNSSERTVKSPGYPPKAEPRAMPHLPSTKKRTENAHARPTSLQHPPRKSGGAGAFMSSGLRPTERVARSARLPDLATRSSRPHTSCVSIKSSSSAGEKGGKWKRTLFFLSKGLNKAFKMLKYLEWNEWKFVVRNMNKKIVL